MVRGHIHQRNNSFSFLTEQAFFIAIAAMETIAPFTFLAFSGHCFTQRIQAMHFLESAVKSVESMACTGQFSAHRAHFTQLLVGFGTSPAPPAFYRGDFRGWRRRLRFSLRFDLRTAPTAFYRTRPVCRRHIAA